MGNAFKLYVLYCIFKCFSWLWTKIYPKSPENSGKKN